ncbi:ABC transporter G family member 41 isoform X2 [Iris pallida]|uniref:ABC transporter G family member 41 isoform X2 n=1 Tax=Iris pallida TaxID=29817 RepID=A0AAX6DW29_IRIPA|nr:ABC transporter G family member 41 isoform X2 [Iris pallida]KAJ6852730.1 ABC transporter G family member 41 isoform X2 [Iris pallida]
MKDQEHKWGLTFDMLITILVPSFTHSSMKYWSYDIIQASSFYKQWDFYFYATWLYALPACILKVNILWTEPFLWTSLTYYVIGYSPEASRQRLVGMLMAIGSGKSTESSAMTMSYFSLGARLSTE